MRVGHSREDRGQEARVGDRDRRVGTVKGTVDKKIGHRKGDRGQEGRPQERGQGTGG
jgi:hypothetical protein